MGRQVGIRGLLRNDGGKLCPQHRFDLFFAGEAADEMFTQHCNGAAQDKREGNGHEEHQLSIGKGWLCRNQGCIHDAAIGQLQLCLGIQFAQALKQRLVLRARNLGGLLQRIDIGQHFRRQVAAQNRRPQFLAKRVRTLIERGHLLLQLVDFSGRLLFQILLDARQFGPQVDGPSRSVCNLLQRSGELLLARLELPKSLALQIVCQRRDVAIGQAELRELHLARPLVILLLDAIQLGAQPSDIRRRRFLLDPVEVLGQIFVEIALAIYDRSVCLPQLPLDDVARRQCPRDLGLNLLLDIGGGDSIGEPRGLLGIPRGKRNANHIGQVTAADAGRSADLLQSLRKQLVPDDWRGFARLRNSLTWSSRPTETPNSSSANRF